PTLTPGTALLGVYEGGGYDEPRYLVSRGDGQMVLISRMLNAVASALDGKRSLEQVAEEASRHYGAELNADAVRYLVENKLRPLGLATMGVPDAPAPKPNPLLALSLRFVLMPAWMVRRVAALFAPMFRPPVIVLVLATLLAMDVWLLVTGRVGASIHLSVGSPGLMLTIMGVVLAGTLFHEFGHAAGCHYGGGKPAQIGVGVLIVVPAFYTNVNDAYRLDRRGRLRTDLGGIYFNAIFAVFLGALCLWTGFPALPAIIVMIHIQMMQQLLPLVRMDGYYILGDLVGVPNLFEQIRPIIRHSLLRKPPERAVTNLRKKTRVVITTWVSLVVPALVLALVNLAIFVPSYFRSAVQGMSVYYREGLAAFDNGSVSGVLLALLSVIILLVPWVGISTMVVRTTAKIVFAVNRRLARRRKAASAPNREGDGGLPAPEFQRAE
ncbi:hypothetical protein, partial [Amycolatopsis rhizosphaerae]|uniref:hypothetical protein n=1 Tax=Amycolatopsis rhizosphaerae TaxID=2053003 RepID=UPI0016437749